MIRMRIFDDYQKKLTHLPFIEKEDGYRVDQEKMSSIFEDMQDKGYTDIERIQAPLYALHFTHQEVMDKMIHHCPLLAYEEWQRQCTNYLIEQRFYIRHLSMDNEEPPKRSKAPSPSHRVLNHRNPFADVSITNQAFLYPTEDGYEQLSFQSNRHFTRKEQDDHFVYAITPGFKVTKQTIGTPSVALLADDTVSTELPKEKEGKKIVYL